MIAGIGIAKGEGSLPADAFPGRWNPRRAIPPDVEPAATAAAIALESASWWRRGSGEACAGGLIVACDHASYIPAARFARELRDGPPSAVGPSGFLFALPSSTAAVLGLLFGFTEYQATVAGGASVGAQALGHALDLLELRRLRRVLLVALSVAEGERVAVAWCLDAEARCTRYPVRLDCGVVGPRPGATIVDPGNEFLAAGLLLAASERVGREPGADRVCVSGAWISMHLKGSTECP